ncbi:cellulase N-terminal Ig-like domain-containing protein [Streptomyces phaeochromogenes]|uniref:cellulase N-terminal Ig-like domain-containing protein n=1 Tax=Streptomyces phaeochromogenes TaxID=1923 RepID=UPI0036A2D698
MASSAPSSRRQSADHSHPRRGADVHHRLSRPRALRRGLDRRDRRLPVRINRLGYLPEGPKRATDVNSSTQPLAWQLRHASGQTVTSGSITPRGTAAASGDSTHLVGFSTYAGTLTGTGARVCAPCDAAFASRCLAAARKAWAAAKPSTRRTVRPGHDSLPGVDGVPLHAARPALVELSTSLRLLPLGARVLTGARGQVAHRGGRGDFMGPSGRSIRDPGARTRTPCHHIIRNGIYTL